MRPVSASALFVVVLAALATVAQADTQVHEELTRLAQDITYTSARLFPLQATQLGIAGHDGELDTPSEQNRAAYVATLQQWQKRLGEIAPDAAADVGLVDRDDARLLGAQLASNLNALLVRETDRKDYAAGANNIVGTIFFQLQFMPVAGRDGRTAADVDQAWADLTSRLSKSSRYIEAAQRLATRPGHLFGLVGSEQLEGAPSFFNAAIAELRRFVTEHDVVTVPQWLGTINVQETPKFLQPVSPGASMVSPRLFSSETNGYYFITPPTSLTEAAARLDMNQDFDRDRILSTAAHEAMPGHFLQLSIAKRHPDFIRKMQGSGVFAEGWAFYGEEMFVRLGLYGDDLDGRLFTARWERVRGARAIVDPKLASGEWTYEQAAQFYARESGFTKEAAAAAVASIATRPGYYIAYTIGRWQLEQLLSTYLQKSGENGSLHDFHDRLLSYGCAPFAVVAPELIADLDKPATAVRAAANY
jgi:uncharacterized protein (DUF885 family)